MENEMSNFYSMAFVLVLACGAQAQTNVTPMHVNLASRNKNTRELFQESMGWEEQFWDSRVKLIQNPTPGADQGPSFHYMVRESSWYALGLLLRDGPGDRERAAEILEVVLKEQYTSPGVRWYGTYKRTPEEPDPVSNSVMWRDYDPNWREFIGTTFELILVEYADKIPSTLVQRLYAAIDRSIEGEIAEKRLVPSYSNIALMYGALWDFAATYDKRADWKSQSAQWTESVYSLFKRFEAFDEFNSPTYYGVDLYGLALWRDYGSTTRIRFLGSTMEAALWNEIASFYQPSLRNISGPYDRSYGMDMGRYVAVTGVWMRSVLDAQIAPFPTITASTDHLADLWFAPHIAILKTRIPPSALIKFKRFEGEHLVRKQITEDRVATAWIGAHLIFGGEATNKTKDVGSTSQFHPATVQWRTPSGEIGWVQLVQSPMINVIADKRGLTITATGTVRLRIHANNMAQSKIVQTSWELPGLRVVVTSDAKNFNVERTGDTIDLVYVEMSKLRLDISTQK